MSSPEGQGLGALDDIQVLATMKFLRACEDDRGNFNASRAETTLRDAWVTEKMLLQDGRDYWISLEGRGFDGEINPTRSEEHTSELQSLMRISYAVFCLKKKKQ